MTNKNSISWKGKTWQKSQQNAAIFLFVDYLQIKAHLRGKFCYEYNRVEKVRMEWFWRKV